MSTRAPIWWLALGTFAIGTEAFMIAPLLPTMAADLGVGVTQAGALVSAFALTYALSSPILTTLAGDLDRRRVLIAAMVFFTAANVLAVVARDYWWLMAARILLALAAGLYVPNANALASALVAPEWRGRALAIVNGGTTLAITFGVPLGGLLGGAQGWRMTFAGVGVLGAIAVAALVFGLPRSVGAGLPTATLGQRLGVARQPAVLLTLGVTLMWAAGAYVVYPYLALVLEQAARADGTAVGLMLFLWGAAAAAGLFLGGYLTDRYGAGRVAAPALGLLALNFVALSMIPRAVPAEIAIWPIAATIVLWGTAGWSVFPAQQTRLIELAGPKAAPVALSLNASFLYLGFSIGAAVGGSILARATAGDLGWVAAVAELAAFLVLQGAGLVAHFNRRLSRI